MFYKSNSSGYCRHGSGNPGCVPCAIEGAYEALHKDNLRIIALLESQSAQHSAQRIGLWARFKSWWLAQFANR